MNEDMLPVLDEITALIKKHNLMGLVIIGNGKDTDYRMEISPPWSCASFVPGGPGGSYGIRVRSKLTDYSDKAAQKKTLDQTVGTIMHFKHITGQLNENMQTLLQAISMHVDIEDDTRRNPDLDSN